MLQNIQSPTHPLLAQALPKRLLSACRFANPPPIKIMALEEGCFGFCEPLDQAPQGEVHLDECLFTRGYPVSLIRRIYLHEAAHRLIGVERAHDPAFFALYTFLLLRAREGFDDLGFYDIQDFRRGLFVTPGQALDWSLAQAYSLASKPVTAEQAAAEITRRFENYGRSPAWLRKWAGVSLLVTAFISAWLFERWDG